MVRVLALDHAVYVVSDLDEAAIRFREDLGLDSVPGGRHPGWGTANRIVPLGHGYLELIAVVDPVEAAASDLGRAVLRRVADGDGWWTFALATDDLDTVAASNGLEVRSGSRERPDGSVLRWRMAGIDDPRREPWLPFFLSWDVPEELHPGRQRAGHGTRAGGLDWVEVGGDAARLDTWLGGREVPIRVVEGDGALLAVGVGTADGELVIR